jgi:ABC-2 type transport system ATP-binding protein
MKILYYPIVLAIPLIAFYIIRIISFPSTMSENQIVIENLSKTYDNGFSALKKVNLNIKKGEIFAMLGPNGAGKTSLISIICGIVTPTSGKVTVDGFDIIENYRDTRSRIGLVPQELTLESFETVFNNVSYTRGLYGKAPNPTHIEKILKDLSLWDKKDQRLRQLSGGMKRRVLIAKALSHEPSILFLDEPTAGVDVELRQDMWKVVEALRKTGVTIILTTHYIEEAEAIADRVGVINQGEIIIVDQTKELLKKMGHKKLTVDLQEQLAEIPSSLEKYNLELGSDKMSVNYTYNVQAKQTGITNLLQDLKDSGLKLKDLKTEQSTLEKIFVSLVKENNEI